MALLAQAAQLSAEVGQERGRKAKIARLADWLRGLAPPDLPIGACVLAGELPTGRLRIGPAQVREAAGTRPASHPSLTLSELARRLEEIATISGSGAAGRRRHELRDLLGLATQAEQGFLARLLLGELRQGATAGLALEAIAQGAGVTPAQVRRAAMLSGDLAQVAHTAFREGGPGLAAIGLTLFRPIQPMLAQPAAGLDEALEALGNPYLEPKLDGARIQVHKAGDAVRVYSRQGNEVTVAVPEVADLVATLPDHDLVLDGEVIALRPDGGPHPFQVTMRRFGRRLDVEQLRRELPLRPYFFDCIQCSGCLLIDACASERFAALAEAAPEAFLVRRQLATGPKEAHAFLELALAQGHEGLMAKSPESTYEAGARGAHWLKIKQAHTLDLVVLGAEWGSGRRSRWLSNLHLGARDGAGGFVMLGKTFKGLTDAMLVWQTAHLLPLAIATDGRLVRVRPELVLEIAFNEIQESSQYPGGLALRFARVKRHRPDKSVHEADDMEAVRGLFARQLSYRRTSAPLH